MCMMFINRFFIFYLLIVCVSLVAFEINQAAINAGLTIVESGEWKLIESVLLQETGGIKINADNVVIDLQGYTIYGSENILQGIDLQTRNCTIKNGTLSGFSGPALHILNASMIRLQNLSIEHSLHGIQIFNSSDIELDDLNIHDVNNGVCILESKYISVYNCVIKDVVEVAMLINAKSTAIFLNMVRISTCGGDGMIIAADYAQLIKIWIQKGKKNGIILDGNKIFCDSVVSAYNDGSGIILNGSDSVLRTCAAHNNRGDGITLSSNAENNSLILGTYALNGLIGINNQGFINNSASCVQVYENGQRNMYHITNNMAQY